MFQVVSQLVFNKRFRMIDRYLDLALQMQVVVWHFYLYHTTDLALKSNLYEDTTIVKFEIGR